MKFFIVLALSLLSLSSQARMELGVAAGVRSNSAETDLAFAGTTSKMGLQVGPIAYFPIGDFWGLRTGFLYTQRFVTVTNTQQGDVDVHYSYFDIPATAMIRFNEYAGIFGGPVFAFNQAMDVSCSNPAAPSCSAKDVKSFVLPWQIGVNVRPLQNFGADLYFEYVPGDLSANVSEMKSVGINLILYIE